MLLTGVRFFEVGINVTIFCCSAFEKINLSQYLMHSSPAKHESPLPPPSAFFFYFILMFSKSILGRMSGRLIGVRKNKEI